MKNIKPGDIISASSTVYSASGADRARIIFDFLDSNGVVIESHRGTVVQATAAERQRSKIEGMVVPVGAASTRVGLENLDDTEMATAIEHMTNFGPVAMAYIRPPIRSNVETMHDLTYEDGTRAELLKPGEAGANITETRVSFDTAHIDGIPAEDAITQINQALNDAALAQEAADREIVAYYQNSAPASGMKFGDIWIDLDASPFTAANAGHRYQNASGGSSGSLAWYKSPNNALIKLYFDAYNAMSEAEQAQATADGKIKTFFASTFAGLPTTGVSEGDLGFVTGEKATYAWTSGEWVVQSPKNVTDGADNTQKVYATVAGEVMETWQSGELDDWKVRTGGGALSIIAGEGIAGGNVLRVEADAKRYLDRLIPYDPERVYRVRVRVRMTAVPSDLDKDRFYCGVEGVAADGVTMINTAGNNTHSSQHYLAASARRMSTYPLGEWQVFTGYFSGNGTDYGSQRPADNPSTLYTGVAYFRPMFHANYSGGDGTTEIDYIIIESFPKHADFNALALTNGPNMAGADATLAYGTGDLSDNGGLGNRADWGDDYLQSTLPTTIGGYGITDAQPLLPEAVAPEQVLHRDVGGDIYLADKYGPEMNIGARSPNANTTLSLGAGRTPIGEIIVIPNPGKYVAVQAVGYAGGNVPSGDSDSARIGLYTFCEISFDGGGTWSGSIAVGNGWAEHSREDFVAVSPALAFREGVPTGDIHIRFEGEVSEAAGPVTSVQLTAARTGLAFHVAPRSEYLVADAPLAVSIPLTRSGACVRNFDAGTTCTASTTVKATASRNVDTWNWVKRSGTASLIDADQQTVTVRDTKTTDDPADMHNTVVYVEATSGGDGAQSNDCAVTLSFLRSFSPVSVHAPDQSNFVHNNGVVPCTVTLTRTAYGGDHDYSNSWVKRSGAGTIAFGAESPSCGVTANVGPGQTLTGVYRITVTDGRGASGFDDCTATFRNTAGGTTPP